MTVSFENVKVGDLVWLTAKNNNIAKFTVVARRNAPFGVESENNGFNKDDWDTLEILPKPLPTVKGIYLSRTGDVWRIYSDGEPLYYVDCDRYERADFDAIEYAPFTRLIPETEVES